MAVCQFLGDDSPFASQAAGIMVSSLTGRLVIQQDQANFSMKGLRPGVARGRLNPIPLLLNTPQKVPMVWKFPTKPQVLAGV